MERKINDYLESYEDLWHDINEWGNAELPIMDISMDVIDEKDYYGSDFRGDRKVIMMFYTGQSNFFPGIHCIKDVSLDECPIYIFDLASDSEPELIGNFRTYITTVLTRYMKSITSKRASKALSQLKDFSKTLVKVKPYKLKINE